MRTKHLISISSIIAVSCFLLVLVCGFVGNTLQSAGILPIYTPGPVDLVSSPMSTEEAAQRARPSAGAGIKQP